MAACRTVCRGVHQTVVRVAHGTHGPVFRCEVTEPQIDPFVSFLVTLREDYLPQLITELTGRAVPCPVAQQLAGLNDAMLGRAVECLL